MNDFTNILGTSSFRLIANAAFMVVLACVATAMLLERATNGPDAPLTAWLAPKSAVFASRRSTPNFDNIDRTPTASIGRIGLKPCEKSPNQQH